MGLSSCSSFTAKSSPPLFFALLSFFMKYQKRDFASTTFFAKSRIRKIFGVGFLGVGAARPTIWYWWILAVSEGSSATRLTCLTIAAAGSRLPSLVGAPVA